MDGAEAEGEEMSDNWIPFEKGGLLPPERRYVILQLAPRARFGEWAAPAVVIGYLRIYSSGPFFVAPGCGGPPFVVTHWNDCLGHEFKPPLWVFDNRRAAQ
jgi:hypothetical protein